MKIALVHDYLVQDGGAERVLLALHALYPHAPIFTLIHDPQKIHPAFAQADIRSSFLARLPFAKQAYQWYLPLMAHAIESLDLSGFDVVISSSSSFAKGIIVAPETIHICYCHTPTRFLWQERLGYINDLKQPSLIKMILPHFLHRLRVWDRLAAERPDILLTNSQLSRARIQRYYHREANVLHPPVAIDEIPLSTARGSYWLAGGRLVAYKRFDIIVDAFAKLHIPLKIFGTGPELASLKKRAGTKTEFLGWINEKEKRALYQDAIGFLHPQIEDFGITAVEAMAAGKPVIAFGRGGAAETVLPGVSGVRLDHQSWQTLADAVIRFDPMQFHPTHIRTHAELFSTARFHKEMQALIDDAWQKKHASLCAS